MSSRAKVGAVKRLVDLTIGDLTATPVWRYEDGSGDDALVAPETRDSLSRADDQVFLAATEFTLPDASKHLGFCFPVDDSGIDYLQPVIVPPRGGHVRFWFGGPVPPEILSEQWKAVGRPAEEVFPVHFRCLVPVDGSIVIGVIPHVEFSEDASPAGDFEALSGSPEATGQLASRIRLADGSFLPGRPIKARSAAKSRTVTDERRTAPRHKVEEMTVEFSQEALRGTGVVANISRGGMFVRTPRIPGTGPLLRLTVHLPEGRTLFLTGNVVRSGAASPLSTSVSSAGFGLRLSGDSPDYAKLVSQLPDKSKS